MTLTTERVDLPETASPTSAEPPQSPNRLRVTAGWAAVGAALAATGLLAVLSLDDGDRPSRIDTGRVVAEYGSVRAIEHRDEVAVQGGEAMSRTVAEYGSVSAIEHRDEAAVQPREAMSRTVAEHGSVSAIEHRDEAAVQPREAMSRTVAEHGSISAIEHRDDLAAGAIMARAEGLTGLSPAFLQPADRDLDEAWARRSEELAAIAEAAVAGGFTGLSPASLGPIGN
jgi:hypothetical protein